MNDKELDCAAYQDGFSVVAGGQTLTKARLVAYEGRNYAVNPRAILTINCTAQCNAQCFFCYNRLTFLPSGEYCDSQSPELARAIKFARQSGISVASISGGEPTLSPQNLLCLVKTLKAAGFPTVRLHTNGLLLGRLLTFGSTEKPLWRFLEEHGVNELSLSIADDRAVQNQRIMGINNLQAVLALIPELVESNLCVRFSCYLCSEGIWTPKDIRRYLEFAHENGVKNVIFRKAPLDRAQDMKYFHNIDAALRAAGWECNSCCQKSDALIGEFLHREDPTRSVMFSCVSEEPDPDAKIRRLIYMPDKVLYTSWIDPASYLFPSDAKRVVSSLLEGDRGEETVCVEQFHSVPGYIYQDTGQTIDLHVHSLVSDGLRTPCEVLRDAASAGIHKLVFTEHNCLHDDPQALAAFAQEQGIQIPFWGVEVSTVYTVDTVPTLKFHLLVYAKSAQQLSFLEWKYNPNTPRNQYLRKLYDRLRSDGVIEKEWDDLFYIKDPIITRKKMFTRTPVAQAIAESCGIYTGAAKTRYLPPMAYEERYRDYLDTVDIMRLAHENGCVVVLAHPGWIRPYQEGQSADEKDLWLAIVRLAHAGLDGLEISHRLNDSNRRGKLYHLAHGLGLIPTGGSDYHGKPRCTFGVNGTTEENLQCLIAKMK